MKIDFSELGFDLIGGTVLGGIAGMVEYTLAGAVSSLGGAFITVGSVAPFAVAVGALVFAGAVFARVGSNTYKASQIATPPASPA